MLYAILCYNSEDAVGSWSKDHHDETMARLAVVQDKLDTAIMGGATASHLRLGDPLFSHTVFGVYLGLFFWVGLWLRDERVRRIMPGAELAPPRITSRKASP